MPHPAVKKAKASRLKDLRVEASSLIKDTIERLKSKYESDHIDERTLRAIAPLVEDGQDPNVLLARLDFDFFCTQISEIFQPTLHHQVWNRTLITEQSNKYLHRIAGKNTSILAARGSAKSTKLGLFFAWAIGIHALEHMALQTLYISANRELALAKSETIRNIIEYEAYSKIFPMVVPHPKKWAAALWSIDRHAAGIESVGQEEFSMIAAGILGTIASKRTNLIGYDDLVKNAEDIASPGVRRKIVRTHYAVVAPTLFPGGRIIAINTRYRSDDIHVTDFIPSKGWNVLEQSAIIPRRDLLRMGVMKRGVDQVFNTEGMDDDEAMQLVLQKEAELAIQRLKEGGKKEGEEEEADKSAWDRKEGIYPDHVLETHSKLCELSPYEVEVAPLSQFETEDQWEEYLDEEVSYWEKMWSLEYLKSRRSADPASFVYQYQNKVERAEGMGIPPEHIKYGRPPGEFDYFCIGGDLATSKANRADYTVFTLVGKRDSEYWVLDYWRGKVTGNLQKIEHILDLYENWCDNSLGIITPWRVAIEKVAYQASISDDLTRELYHKRSLSHIVVIPTQLRGGKEAHIASVTGAFANGLVIFNEGIDWGVYVEELQGIGMHDDCADSLVIALQTLGVRRRLATVDTGDEMEKIRRNAPNPQGYADPYHGHWL